MLLTLKEFCESFYQTVQDLIMIITNILFIYLFQFYGPHFSLLFLMLFFNRWHVQQVVDDGAHGFRSESYFCKTLIKRSFKSCPPRLPRSLLAPFCRVYSLTLFNCLASAERSQENEIFSEGAFLFSCHFVAYLILFI